MLFVELGKGLEATDGSKCFFSVSFYDYLALRKIGLHRWDRSAWLLVCGFFVPFTRGCRLLWLQCFIVIVTFKIVD